MSLRVKKQISTLLICITSAFDIGFLLSPGSTEGYIPLLVGVTVVIWLISVVLIQWNMPLGLTNLKEEKPGIWTADLWSSGDPYRIAVVYIPNEKPAFIGPQIPHEHRRYAVAYISTFRAYIHRLPEKEALYGELSRIRSDVGITTNAYDLETLYLTG